jgi:hypothetical protein
MKASLISLLPLACFMQSALAAPASVGKDTRAIVGATVASSELVERSLVDRATGPGTAESRDITDISQLGQLAVLVSDVINLVKSIGTQRPRP